MTEKKLTDEELKQVSGGSIGALMDSDEIYNTLRACGDLAWARNNWSDLWSNINYAQNKGMTQERLNGINAALEVLVAQGLSAGLSQSDYSTLYNDLNRCKKAMELALKSHII